MSTGADMTMLTIVLLRSLLHQRGTAAGKTAMEISIKIKGIRVQSGKQDAADEGIRQRSSHLSETLAINAVLMNLVINDAFRRRQEARGFGAITPRGLQCIDDNVLFVACHCIRKR